MISFNCSHCGKAIKARDETAGRKGKCLGCGETIHIPSAAGIPKSPGTAMAEEEQESDRWTRLSTAIAEGEQRADREAAWPPVKLPTDAIGEMLNEDEQARKTKEGLDRITRLMPCFDCGKPISKWASTCPNCGCPLFAPSGPGKYPALELLASVYRIFAGIALLSPVVVIAIAAMTGRKSEEFIPELVLATVAGLMVSLVLWGGAQLIVLLIDIEDNTSTLRGRKEAKYIPRS